MALPEIDTKTKEKAQKKLKEGWIRSWMMIEVLAAQEQAAKSSLEEHVEKLSKEDKTIVFNRSFRDIQKVAKPLPVVAEGYSYVAELELLTANYETLLMLVMNYAPSSVEIIEPEKIRMDVSEAQGILNSISETLHKYAAHGLGGVLIRS
ncbi:MAG: hypothetical protein HY519_04305 [Candidatus Aenigmarchaeota archaeon]|nr:hypothetical protein [Candidatus Aenigmarchaeota archaeon]